MKSFFKKLTGGGSSSSKSPKAGDQNGKKKKNGKATDLTVPSAAGDDISPLCKTKSDDEFLDDDDDDQDESLDSVGDLPSLEPPPNYFAKKQRHSVSAEAYGEWNVKGAFTPPVHPKTDDQTTRIKAALGKGFMFNCLDRKDLATVIDAFVEKKVPAGETIISQGDDGDRLYLIESGDFDVFKLLSGETEARHMCVMGVGDAVGELALLYNCPRAATVTAKTEAILWALDRESFNHIVRDAAARKREMHEAFLAEVELLKDMDPYERSKLADALRTTHHDKGEFVITEGDRGDTFYIIESGAASAIKLGQVVLEYKRGDYFGELALIKDQPRAASVKADTELECVSLDRRSFKRLLGPVDSILRRNASHYKKVKAQLTGIPKSDNGLEIAIGDDAGEVEVTTSDAAAAAAGSDSDDNKGEGDGVL